MRYRFGDCLLDSARRELRVRGERRLLTPKAFTLLLMLVEAYPASLSRDDLAAALWPSTFVEPGNLHNLVAEIRGALRDDEKQIVQTIQRFGYAFALPVAQSDAVRFLLVRGDEEFPLRQGENIIGRDPGAAIVISAPAVSRKHACLVVAGGAVYVEDLGSKNGTFVGRSRLEGRSPLTPHDELVIGTATLRLVVTHALPTTATAAAS